MAYSISFKDIVTEKNNREYNTITISDGRIIDISQNGQKLDEHINMENYTALPGFIDIHIHGADGCDTMDARYESLEVMSKYLASKGVTAFLATTMTAPMDKIENAIKKVREVKEKGVSGAEVLGVYLEGPYLCEERKGAQPAEFLRLPNIDEIEELLNKYGDIIKVIAMAPELEGSIEAIRKIKQNNIKVSLGHSDATSEVAIKAYEEGASISVHTFNGMKPFHHREGGLAAATMKLDTVFAELIADKIHVHPVVMEVLIKAKGIENVCLISDSMRASGLPDGNYKLGELNVIVKDSICRIESGSLAGSTLDLEKALKNIVEVTGISLEEACKMVSLVPAKAIGILDDYGTIKEGKKANITVVDDNKNVVMTIVNGNIVYKK